jgi:hypothetical protein
MPPPSRPAPHSPTWLSQPAASTSRRSACSRSCAASSSASADRASSSARASSSSRAALSPRLPALRWPASPSASCPCNACGTRQGGQRARRQAQHGQSRGADAIPAFCSAAAAGLWRRRRCAVNAPAGAASRRLCVFRGQHAQRPACAAPATPTAAELPSRQSGRHASARQAAVQAQATASRPPPTHPAPHLHRSLQALHLGPCLLQRGPHLRHLGASRLQVLAAGRLHCLERAPAAAAPTAVALLLRCSYAPATAALRLQAPKPCGPCSPHSSLARCPPAPGSAHLSCSEAISRSSASRRLRSSCFLAALSSETEACRGVWQGRAALGAGQRGPAGEQQGLSNTPACPAA